MTKTRILLVGTAVIVGLVLISVAKGAPATTEAVALPIPYRIAVKICPFNVKYVAKFDMTYIGKDISPRHVRCHFILNGRTLVTNHFTRTARCRYRVVMSQDMERTILNTFPLTHPGWCVG